MQLINFDNAGVSRPRALQASSRSRHIASPAHFALNFVFVSKSTRPNVIQ